MYSLARRTDEHSISVEKRSVKATKALEQHQLSHQNLGRERRRSSKEMPHVWKRESQNSEGAKGAVGEGESREKEWLSATMLIVTTWKKIDPN